ncbi:glycosyltransferase family 4 protein [Mesorhizobium sp. M0203]|uniref:glycosyltransferase family 4 protein n=1 Tax=Mesorhizobium sp. M0203 TaxID=2956912 RepID=UPI003339917C
MARIQSYDVAVVMFDAHWLSCMIAALIYPKKTLLWGHGLGRNPVANLMRVILARRAAGVLLYEESAKADFADAGCHVERIFMAGNTVEVMNPRRAQGQRSRFLYVGRLQARKRIDQFLRAFADVRPHLPSGTGITIVGDGSGRGELESLTSSLGIADQVEFLGELYDDDALAAQYARAIAYVSPGHVGLGALHAFGHGVPVVTGKSESHAPEIENVVDGVNGYLYGGENSELGEILIRMCSNSGVAEKMGVNALHRYQAERTIEQMANRFADAIRYVGDGASHG